MTEFIQIQITFPSRESAENVARMLVETRLAACTQILGEIQSLYHWQGIGKKAPG